MSTRNYLRNLTGLALLLAASSAQASGPAPAACVFDDYAPVAVRPYYSSDEPLVYLGPETFLRGVQMYVPAREGLTKEWLTSIMQSALNASRVASSSSAADLTCGPNGKDIQVIATSAGAGFWVQLIAHDDATAAKVLHWAKGLVAEHNRPQREAAALNTAH